MGQTRRRFALNVTQYRALYIVDTAFERSVCRQFHCLHKVRSRLTDNKQYACLLSRGSSPKRVDHQARRLLQKGQNEPWLCDVWRAVASRLLKGRWSIWRCETVEVTEAAHVVELVGIWESSGDKWSKRELQSGLFNSCSWVENQIPVSLLLFDPPIIVLRLYESIRCSPLLADVVLKAGNWYSWTVPFSQRFAFDLRFCLALCCTRD